MKNVDFSFYAMCAIAGYAGLRWGEICGLTWDRIDLDACTLRIDRQWGEVSEGITDLCRLNQITAIASSPLPSRCA